MARIEPDRATLKIVHSKYGFINPFDEMLKSPAQAGVLMTLARKHLKQLAQRDVKKLQANDND